MPLGTWAELWGDLLSFFISRIRPFSLFRPPLLLARSVMQIRGGSILQERAA